MVAVITGLFVMANLALPVVNTVFAAAVFNQGSQPYDFLRVGSSTDDGGTYNWQNQSVNAELGDKVAAVLFFNNTGDNTADNARVRIYPTISSNGQQVNIRGYIWADNAPQKAETVVVNLTGDGEITDVDHLTTSQVTHWNPQRNVSLSGDPEDVLDSGGLLVGDIDSGERNAGFIIVSFRINGDDEPEPEEDDDLEVTTGSPDDVNHDEAVLTCDVDGTNGDDTNVRIQYSEDADELDWGSDSKFVDEDGEVSIKLDNLDEDTKYYYRCAASNDNDSDTGSVRNFTTDGDGGGGTGDKPSATTLSADNIDEDSARLRCEVDTNGDDADVWFEWGEDTDLDEDTSKVSVNDDETNETVTKTITGLDEDTKHYFRCRIEDDGGETDTGSTKNFTTDENGGGSTSGNEPEVLTLAPSGVTQTSSVLEGEVDANNSDTDVWFEWGTSINNLTRDTSREDVGDNDNVKFDFTVTNLTANTTYFYRATAENDEGTDSGIIRSFRTGAPIVNVITRIVETIRPVQVQEEEEIKALIITLDADRRGADENSREIDYTVSYDNRTDETFTNAVLVVDLPRELAYVDSDPNADNDRDDVLTFEIGTISPDEQDSFMITTEVDADVDINDTVRFVGDVEYTDSGTRKLVTVINEHTFGELIGGRTGGTFTALLLDNLRNFFTSPILWLILLVLLIYFAIRYFVAGRDRRSATLV